MLVASFREKRVLIQYTWPETEVKRMKTRSSGVKETTCMSIISLIVSAVGLFMGVSAMLKTQ